MKALTLSGIDWISVWSVPTAIDLHARWRRRLSWSTFFGSGSLYFWEIKYSTNSQAEKLATQLSGPLSYWELWSILSLSVYKVPEPKNVDQLKRRLQRAWRSIAVWTRRTLIQFMPDQVSAVIKQKWDKLLNANSLRLCVIGNTSVLMCSLRARLHILFTVLVWWMHVFA